MKKNLIITLALAAASVMPSFAENAPANVVRKTVQDPSLASSQPAATQVAQETTTIVTAQEMEPARKKPIGVFVDVNVGTLGVGMNVGYEFNRYLKLRVRGNYQAADYEDTWNTKSKTLQDAPIDGKFEFEGSGFGILLDYHPFGGCFHLTGGINIAGSKVDAKATMEHGLGAQFNGVYEFGDHYYKVEDLQGTAEVKGRYKWNRVQPYLGFGWSSNGKGTRSIYFSCDIGVNFIGKGELSVNHSGADISVVDKDGNPIVAEDLPFGGNLDAILEDSLRKEGKDFFDIADKIIVWPVLQFGIGGRF